jgi:hypothetical protein
LEDIDVVFHRRRDSDMNCPDLRKLFGIRFQLTRDPACKDKRDPWMVQVPCRYGVIYPYGPGLLAVECDGHRKVANELADVPGLRLVQDGDGEWTFLFPLDLAETVFRIVRPKRLRGGQSNFVSRKR